MTLPPALWSERDVPHEAPVETTAATVHIAIDRVVTRRTDPSELQSIVTAIRYSPGRTGIEEWP